MAGVSPEGAAEASVVSRPYGTHPLPHPYPTLKRWAILNHPFGMKGFRAKSEPPERPEAKNLRKTRLAGALALAGSACGQSGTTQLGMGTTPASGVAARRPRRVASTRPEALNGEFSQEAQKADGEGASHSARGGRAPLLGYS